VLDLEQTKTTQKKEISSQHNEIASLKKRVKKLKKRNRSRTHRLKRLYKVSLSTRVESSGDEESLDEDASKQERRINAIDADEDITLVSAADNDMFDVDVLGGEKVFVVGQNENVVDEVVDAAQVSNVATTVTITTEETTLAQALEALKTSKPKVKGIVFQEPGKSTTTTTTIISSQQSQDKGKRIMIKEPMKPNKKDRTRLDEEDAKKLQAKFDEEERFAREKSMKDERANIYLIEKWDDIQAKIDAHHQLAKRLQLMETILDEEEVAIDAIPLAIKSPRIVDWKIHKEGKKRYYQILMETILDEEEVAIDAILLAIKSPRIVDWKIHKEGKKRYYQIVRADGKSQMYMIFSQLLKSFDKEDLEDLYKLVKARYGSTRPVESMDYLLWSDMKIMFEPHVEDEGRIVRIKSLLDVVGITVAQVYVNTAMINYAYNGSLLLIPLCCDDIHDVTPHISALARQHGQMILESVQNGPLIWPTIEENDVNRPRKYFELTPAEAIQADCDVKATNIILQGLPPEVYALVSNHKVSKDLWERIQLLMQGTSLTNQERECKLYDEFDKFAYKKGETLHDFYLRFSLLLNDMNIYNLKLEQFQVNTKFLNTLPPERRKFVTYVKLFTTTFILHHNPSYNWNILQQLNYNHNNLKFPQLDSRLTILVFKKGDDPIDAVNHMMSFLSVVVTSRYPTTNNQLRNSSNPRQQATINDGRVTYNQYKGDKFLLLLELLILIRPTCLSINNSSDKLVAVTPKNKDKSVRFTEPVTSSGNTNTKTASSSNLVSNKLVLSSTGVKSSTSASESHPSGNTKKDKIQRPPSSIQKNKVETHLRTVKSSLKNKNYAVEPKGTVVQIILWYLDPGCSKCNNPYFSRMPFGLCNAPGTFQRCMMAIFHDMIKKTMEVFMDDFSAFENSFRTCLSHLDKMIKRCEDTNLCLNWEKSHFMVKESIVLGHKISKNEIEVGKAKVDVIAKLPHPTTVKGIRSFLSHAGFYRRFIQDFSKIAQLMTRLLKKVTPFFFSKECIEAFQTLMKKLTEAPILVAPDWDLPFELMCEASNFAIGAVLGQRKTKHFQPIHPASKTMTDAQAYYTATENELLAMVKQLIFLRLATMNLPGDIMARTTPPKRCLTPVSTGLQSIVMPRTWSNLVTLVNVRENFCNRMKCLKIPSKFERSSTYGASISWGHSRLHEGTSIYSWPSITYQNKLKRKRSPLTTPELFANS
nr:reverse transcriptase domain-containing protein [Tanacetum cinerariifolium]